MNIPDTETLRSLLGEIDIYFLDQIFKGCITTDMKILDAGCGYGRNIRYLIRAGYDVSGFDISEDDIKFLKDYASKNSTLSPDNFRMETIDNNSFQKENFDYVICNSVLHFAKDQAHFDMQLNELWKLVKRGAKLFIRTASCDGISKQVMPIYGGQYLLPDGSKRFLINEDFIKKKMRELNASYAEPLKTVIVHNARSMTTWVMKK